MDILTETVVINIFRKVNAWADKLREIMRW